MLRKGDETLLDQTVLFGTRREGGQGLVFEGEASTEKEGLRIHGGVSLGSSNPGVPGHPTLLLALHRGDEDLGSGELRLGYFADLKDGYRLGAAGLKKWAEIDVSRRTYPGPILGGAALVALGAVVWGAGAWRGR